MIVDHCFEIPCIEKLTFAHNPDQGNVVTNLVNCAKNSSFYVLNTHRLKPSIWSGYYLGSMSPVSNRNLVFSSAQKNIFDESVSSSI